MKTQPLGLVSGYRHLYNVLINLEVSLTNSLEGIARGEVDATSARTEIDFHIEATRDFTKPYSALLRWTWLALSERRVDDDLRCWHRLMLDIAARAGKEPDIGADVSGGVLAERLRAMSDVIRVSIGMQSRPDKVRLLKRAHVPIILQTLKDWRSKGGSRADLSEAVGLRTASLSRILTLLILEGLVERQTGGRTARFCITDEGVRHLEDHLVRNGTKANAEDLLSCCRPEEREVGNKEVISDYLRVFKSSKSSDGSLGSVTAYPYFLQDYIVHDAGKTQNLSVQHEILAQFFGNTSHYLAPIPRQVISSYHKQG